MVCEEGISGAFILVLRLICSRCKKHFTLVAGCVQCRVELIVNNEQLLPSNLSIRRWFFEGNSLIVAER